LFSCQTVGGEPAVIAFMDFFIYIKGKRTLEKIMSEHITVTGANFEDEVLKSDVPVLVDFWASWCGPCRMIAPLIDQLADEYAGRIRVGKVNVDEEGDLAASHSVVSIPTLVVYQGGKIVNQKVGAMPKGDIEKLFKDFV
jgi:thioredoxin 1